MEITFIEFVALCEKHGVVMVSESALEGLWNDLRTSKRPSNNLFIARYCEAYKAKYGVNPSIVGSEAGIAKSLVKDLGTEKACELVEFYLSRPEYRINGHDLKTLKWRLAAISLQMKTGQGFNQAQVRQVEHKDANVAAAQEYLAKRRTNAVS